MVFYKKTAKLIFTCCVGLGLMACDGQVEFDEIPVAKSLCEGDDCIAPEIPGPGYTLKSGKKSVMQTGSGGSVDILIVVDNSYSMAEVQKKMGQRFGDLVKELEGIDWQLAFTTSDSREYNSHRFNGRLLNLEGASGKILNSSTPNLLTVFRETIDRTEDMDNCGSYKELPCASNNEEPLKVIKLAIDRRDSSNAGFFRTNSALAIIALTDEDEQSKGGANATKPFSVVEHVVSAFGSSKKLVVNGIIIQPGDDICLAANQPDGVVATHINDLAKMTGGITRSLCDSDYQPSLKAISNKVRKILDIEGIQLKPNPVKSSIKLEFVPADHAVDWELKNGKIVFAKPPKDGTEILVDYRYRVKKMDSKDDDNELGND